MQQCSDSIATNAGKSVASLHHGMNKHLRRGRVVWLTQHQQQEQNAESGVQGYMVEKSVVHKIKNVDAWNIRDSIKEQNTKQLLETQDHI